jgi:hypothetical protein
MHLFFECNFSQRIWSYLQIDWTLAQGTQGSLSVAKLAFRKPFFYGGGYVSLLKAKKWFNL